MKPCPDERSAANDERLMITARAAREPRSSQNVTVAVTPICPNGRKDKVLRLDVM